MSTCGSTSSTVEGAADLPLSLPRWSHEKANRWYAEWPWLVGCNYIPATASNQLEMWQAETFDPLRIDRELAWAKSLGLNAMRVFLHDLLWDSDADGFADRIDQYLEIASRHGITTLLVLFDSCWNPLPRLGMQEPHIPGVHNSRWVQSPGRVALEDPETYPRLQAYVTGLLGRFGQDPRILGWDLWNEPDNENTASYRTLEPANKLILIDRLLPRVFDWARSTDPSQPLTSGLWMGDWSRLENLTPVQRTQIEQSDVISFHNYEGACEFEKCLGWLIDYRRPLLCTEFMARSRGSTFQQILPIAKAKQVAALSWGLVAGKTQTHFPWDSWQKPCVAAEPELWFHEILRYDGSPYCLEEVEAIRNLTRPHTKAMAVATGR